MTEAEALTKWCPFSRATVVAPNDETAFAGNRGINKDKSIHENPPWARCIASACMAWRWNEPWTSQTEEGVGGDLVLRLKRKPGAPKLGYCGLAGVPL